MIQRIQSLYLFIAAALMAAMAFMPFIEITEVSGGGNTKYAITALGVENAVADVPVMALFGGIMLLAAAVSFVTIFMYKYRRLQLRMTGLGIILLILVMLFAAYIIHDAYNGSGNETGIFFAVKFTVCIPVAALFFMWLARRGIKKDIKLISSLDRIR